MAATHARRGLRRDQESLSTRRLIVTTGEPAGIGPDLALAAALADWPSELVFAGDPDLLSARASMLGLRLTLCTWRADAPPAPHRAGTLPVLPVRLARRVEPGRPDPANARYVLDLLDAAAERCLAGRFDAMVTAPVQKSAINDAGIPFRGHTEYLAAKGGGAHPVMLLVAGRLRVALATTHLPLAEVPRAITRESLERTLQWCSIADCARTSASPRRASSSAGSIRTPARAATSAARRSRSSRPAVAALAARGLAVAGPVPADTAFTPQLARARRRRARDVPRPGPAGDQARGFRQAP